MTTERSDQFPGEGWLVQTDLSSLCWHLRYFSPVTLKINTITFWKYFKSAIKNFDAITLQHTMITGDINLFFPPPPSRSKVRIGSNLIQKKCGKSILSYTTFPRIVWIGSSSSPYPGLSIFHCFTVLSSPTWKEWKKDVWFNKNTFCFILPDVCAT